MYVYIGLEQVQEIQRIISIYLLMKDAENVLLFVNAVSRLVFEANGKSELRKENFTLLLAGPVTVIIALLPRGMPLRNKGSSTI
jgi:hypothetical protein